MTSRSVVRQRLIVDRGFEAECPWQGIRDRVIGGSNPDFGRNFPPPLLSLKVVSFCVGYTCAHITDTTALQKRCYLHFRPHCPISIIRLFPPQEKFSCFFVVVLFCVGLFVCLFVCLFVFLFVCLLLLFLVGLFIFLIIIVIVLFICLFA